MIVYIAHDFDDL